MNSLAFLPLIPMACALLSSAASAQQLPPIPVPLENPITEEKRVLGKLLFWEEQLSSDDSMACGTCHITGAAGSDPRRATHPGADLSFGGADDVIGSFGVVKSDSGKDYTPSDLFDFEPQVTGRNSPVAVGAQWSRSLFWDGRATGTFLNPDDGSVSILRNGALENQVVGPPLSDVEMGHAGRDWAEITAKLSIVTPMRLATNLPADMATALDDGAGYPQLFEAAFGSAEITAERIAFAIATYERTLVANQTPFDRFMAGEAGAMTPAQQRGFNLLANQTVCFNCHTPPLFTDNRFHNIGLRPASEDIGRQAVTGNPADLGRFKTPSLRNLKLRNSLMHVGWVTNAQDALDFYNSGTRNTGHTQFTADQSRIPGTPILISEIAIPRNAQPDIIEFLENGLLDPRLEAELFPFDRPSLNSESTPANPELYGASSGATPPKAIARSPLHDLAPDFKVGLSQAEAGGLGLLAVSIAPAPLGSLIGNLNLHVDLSPGRLLNVFSTAISGAGDQGFGTLQASTTLGLQGRHFFGQWFVLSQSPGGLSASEGIHWIAR